MIDETCCSNAFVSSCMFGKKNQRKLEKEKKRKKRGKKVHWTYIWVSLVLDGRERPGAVAVDVEMALVIGAKLRAMGDREDGGIGEGFEKVVADLFGFFVECRCCFVENGKGRLAQDQTQESETLLFTNRG